MVGLLLVLQVGALSAQNPANAVYDRVILSGHVMDPASTLDAVSNIGLTGGRIAIITTHALRGRDTQRSASRRVNYGVSIGHIKVRLAVMHDSGTWMPVSDGAYRAASPAQIGEIAQRMEIGLREGAVDIGAGFPYTPAATRDELLAVFRVAAQTKTPIRSEERRVGKE